LTWLLVLVLALLTICGFAGILADSNGVTAWVMSFTAIIAVVLGLLLVAPPMPKFAKWLNARLAEPPPIEVEFPDPETVVVTGTENLCDARGRPVAADEELWVMILIRG
jgi:hypothetical protein